MCGRFANWANKNKILKHYDLLDGPDQTRTGYNISPSQDIPIVRLNKGKKELINAHWGFIPPNSTDRKKYYPNMRSDRIKTLRTFRDAFRNTRCLIPVTGFYEWQEIGKARQPYFFKLTDSELFSFAGIWSRWDSPAESVDHCGLITTEPNEIVRPVHNRMPVIIKPGDYDAWLENGGEEFLKPYDGPMESWSVSLRVGNPRNQGPELAEPAPPVFSSLL